LVNESIKGGVYKKEQLKQQRKQTKQKSTTRDCSPTVKIFFFFIRNRDILSHQKGENQPSGRRVRYRQRKTSEAPQRPNPGELEGL